MQKKFKKKNVLLRSQKKEKKKTLSIHRAKHNFFRKCLVARLRHYGLTAY
jgi:hypothetical protein